MVLEVLDMLILNITKKLNVCATNIETNIRKNAGGKEDDRESTIFKNFIS